MELNCPSDQPPIFTLATFFPKRTPNQIAKKLKILAAIDIANGESPINPTPKPFVSAFIETAVPKMIASKLLMSPEWSTSAFSGELK